MNKIIIINKEKYFNILDVLFSKCDECKIVHTDYNNDQSTTPEIINSLLPYCKHIKDTKRWPGTITSSKNNKIYTFDINKHTLKIFKNYSNFFNEEYSEGTLYYDSYNSNHQLDTSFYYKEECVFYTIVHKGECYIRGEL